MQHGAIGAPVSPHRAGQVNMIMHPVPALILVRCRSRIGLHRTKPALVEKPVRQIYPTPASSRVVLLDLVLQLQFLALDLRNFLVIGAGMLEGLFQFDLKFLVFLLELIDVRTQRHVCLLFMHSTCRVDHRNSTLSNSADGSKCMGITLAAQTSRHGCQHGKGFIFPGIRSS